VPKSIAVFGAGPALGRAVARRYADEGYQVALVARRREPLEQLAGELPRTAGHAIAADLSDTGTVPALAAQIRDRVGDLDALYYGPTGGAGFGPASAQTPADAAASMPLAFYTLVGLVREFLPAMKERHSGAVLAAAGASAVQGMPNFSGPGPALAAARNYLQSLHAEVADDGIYVGGLYIGTTIKGSAWHTRMESRAEADRPAQARGPVVDPGDLADLLWTMHHTTRQPEALYPEDLFAR
jgi:NADP-dependent 3-hydroxy acid dehydrogenase YdfG